jgi:hypothetical protein
MSIEAFTDLVRNHFGYLLEEYGFSVQEVKCYRVFGNCSATLQSQVCEVVVSRDRSQILVDILSKVPNGVFTLTNVIGFIMNQRGDAYEPYLVLKEISAGSEEEQWKRVGELLEHNCPAILALFQDVAALTGLQNYVKTKTAEYTLRVTGQSG